MSFCTACGNTPVQTEQPSETQPQDDSRQQADEDTENVIYDAMVLAEFSEKASKNVHIIFTDNVSDKKAVSALPVKDNIGKGIKVTTEDGTEYAVYIDGQDNVFGIKDLQKNNYVYEVYEQRRACNEKNNHFGTYADNRTGGFRMWKKRKGCADKHKQ